MGCLYKLTSPSGKSYIGITIGSFPKRLSQHKHSAKKDFVSALYKAVRKYGWDNFNKEILVVADGLQYLSLLERKAIKIYNTLSPNGYNLMIGGAKESILSEESMLRKKQALRNAWNSNREDKINSLKVAWHKNYEQRKLATKNATDAMARALKNPVIENKRRAKISETMKDKRIGIGSSNSASILDENTVLQIRRKFAEGYNLKDISTEYKISMSLASFIKNRKRWAHI